MSTLTNKVSLIGNLGKDPELLTLGDAGYKKVNLSLATSHSRKKKDGSYENYTEWHRIVAWGKMAEKISNDLKKGSKMAVDGKLTNGSYEKDGITRYYTEVEASEYLTFSSFESPEISLEAKPKTKA